MEMKESGQEVLGQEQAQLIAKALADPRRYEILTQLRECSSALACETMRGCMEISPATLSHHMKELETAGLIEVVRKGKFVSYLLRREVLEAFFERLRTDLICSG
jgi:ArsR family transcriptional regulator, arsenate/arsenite/antimonite-responsive transcriptional repressor